MRHPCPASARRLALPLMIVAGLIVAGPLASGARAADGGKADARRIVSVGGTITEILYALGASDRIVAVDSTSSYPAEARAKPNVGYLRALSAEGVLAQTPDLVLAEGDAGPPDVMAILKASAVPVTIVAGAPDGAAIAGKIRDVGAAVGLADKAAPLAKRVDDAFAALAAETAALPQPRKRVLFVLSLANGRIMAGGAKTEADAIIRLAGGVNALTGVEGYKPVTDEAVIAAAPDAILVMQRGEHRATPEQVFAMPAFQTTPAAAGKTLIAMDGLLLLGFGPRTPEAARSLASTLYPGAITP
ncbi:heme/hemin ABC transporter substrate-binding protein [Ensifer soli]|uniref:heme/hemin ABC transporter substrate-binding protein n=1 Tax=Ciceribacter sp. sgz301302 TaxID=3342379 RepID=UPI0035B79814